MPSGSPLRTADAGIDGQDNHRNIGKFTSLQHPDERGDVRQRWGPDTGPDEEFSSIALDIVNKLAPWLFSPGKKFPIRGTSHLDIYGAIGDFLYSLPYKVDGSEKLFRSHRTASITVATCRRRGLHSRSPFPGG
jgi:hypothetical protein